MQWNIRIFVSLFQSNFLSSRVTYKKKENPIIFYMSDKKEKKLHDFINFRPLNKVAVCSFITNKQLQQVSCMFLGK